MNSALSVISSLINSGKILGVTCDSRKVSNGYLFAAFNGYKTNGEDFIDDAISKGAVAVVKFGEDDAYEVKNNIVFAYSSCPRKFFAKICSLFFKDIPQRISAVTGTNGKTSIVNLANQILWLIGRKSAAIGTLGVMKDKFNVTESLTTPDTVSIYETLQKLKKEGIEDVFMEASSQGLHQNRIDYLPIQNAVLTNIKSDHMDYHKTMFDYFSAKMHLFKDIVQRNIIVHNEYENVMKIPEVSDKTVIDYGANGRYINISIIEKDEKGTKVFIRFLNNTFIAHTKIDNMIQLENLLAAITLAYYHGCSIEDIEKVIPDVDPIKGRMEKVGVYNGGSIIIDYAHNADGLQNVLKCLSEENHNKLIVVFGCGGNRDSGKRKDMGEIASLYSDIVIITDDNPRDENPEKIRKEILNGTKSRNDLIIKNIGDRYEAIKTAISMLGTNDILLIAGKGLEEFQILANNQKVKYSDYDSVKKAIEEISKKDIKNDNKDKA